VNKQKTLVLYVITVVYVLIGGVVPVALLAAENPCTEDYKKLCNDVKPGGGRIDACLQKNEAKLSDACRQQREAIKTKRKAVAQACGNDAKTLCAGVKPGGGRILRCLNQKQAEVSPACKDNLGKYIQ